MKKLKVFGLGAILALGLTLALNLKSSDAGSNLLLANIEAFAEDSDIETGSSSSSTGMKGYCKDSGDCKMTCRIADCGKEFTVKGGKGKITRTSGSCPGCGKINFIYK